MSDAESKGSQANRFEQDVLDHFRELRAKREDHWKKTVSVAERIVAELAPGALASYGSVIGAISRDAYADRALTRRALDDLQRRGVARYQFGVGVSNTGEHRLANAQ